MPHVIIEYSDNLAAECDLDGLINAVHEAAASSPIVPLAGLRTRAVSRSHYQIADGDPTNAFVAVVARLGPGRTDDQKSDLLDRLMNAVCDTLELSSTLLISFSVEYQEIDASFRRNKNQVRTRMERESSD